MMKRTKQRRYQQSSSSERGGGGSSSSADNNNNNNDLSSTSSHLRARARSSSPPPTPPSAFASPKPDKRPRIPPRSISADDVSIPSHSLRRTDHRVISKQPPPPPPSSTTTTVVQRTPPSTSRHKVMPQREVSSCFSTTRTSSSARGARRNKLPAAARPKELWQWTVWSASFIFRATSILGLLLFFVQYAFLAAGMNVEVKLIAHMDWNMLGLEEMDAVDPDLHPARPIPPPAAAAVESSLRQRRGTGDAPGQQQQQQQSPLPGENNVVLAHFNHQAAAATAVTKHTPLQPLNVTLPPWIICPDGRNVTSCHACAATHPPHLLGIAGCASSPSANDDSPACQWCPYGAVWDTTMPQTENENQGVLVYDDQGQASKLFHAHIPLGAQCVSTRQTCRRAPSGILPQQAPLWQQDVELLQTKPFLVEMARKAAPHIVTKQCQSRGFRYCPYGALHTYHEAMQEAMQSNDPNNTTLAPPHRPPQCVPRRLHCQPPDELLVQPNDRLYRQRYGSAVVIPSHKLIFIPIPKVASTTWLKLFRRMRGLPDWKSDLGPLPHNADVNGLTYLADYSRAQATDMWTSPAWTKAVMIRDPKERLLSAYLDKVVRSPTLRLVHGTCCPDTNDCAKDPNMTLEQFVDMLVERDCWNTGDHWNLQYERLERKYWSDVTMILQSSRADDDARKLLESVGAWSDFGASGWGPKGTDAIFGPSVTTRHATNATAEMATYYKSPELEAKVEKMLYKDYRQKRFGFVRGNLVGGGADNADKVKKVKAKKTRTKKIKA